MATTTVTATAHAQYVVLSTRNPCFFIIALLHPLVKNFRCSEPPLPTRILNQKGIPQRTPTHLHAYHKYPNQVKGEHIYFNTILFIGLTEPSLRPHRARYGDFGQRQRCPRPLSNAAVVLEQSVEKRTRQASWTNYGSAKPDKHIFCSVNRCRKPAQSTKSMSRSPSKSNTSVQSGGAVSAGPAKQA